MPRHAYCLLDSDAVVATSATKTAVGYHAGPRRAMLRCQRLHHGRDKQAVMPVRTLWSRVTSAASWQTTTTVVSFTVACTMLIVVAQTSRPTRRAVLATCMAMATLAEHVLPPTRARQRLCRRSGPQNMRCRESGGLWRPLTLSTGPCYHNVANKRPSSLDTLRFVSIA